MLESTVGLHHRLDRPRGQSSSMSGLILSTSWAENARPRRTQTESQTQSARLPRSRLVFLEVGVYLFQVCLMVFVTRYDKLCSVYDTGQSLKLST